MDLAKLFPPCTDDGTAEVCTIGNSTFNVADVKFLPLPASEPLPGATWVDGGSAVLFKTPARAIGIIKLCTIRTAALKRTDIIVRTYLVSITASNGSFLVRAEALHNPDDALTACLQREIPRAELAPETTPESLIDVVRSIGEHCMRGGITVHDGSLRSTNQYLQRSIPQDSYAIAKTSGILTSKSRPIGVALLLHAPPGAWYAPLVDSACLVRLHDRASHVFLVENATPEVLALLHAWSADMAFPGYPYPLVLADQMGRVTNNERDAWKVVLASDEAAMKVIGGELRASDAHDMLEHILYGKQLY